MLDEDKYLNGDPNPKINCFRIGLFGIDKIKNKDRTINNFLNKLDKVIKLNSLKE